MSPRGRAVLSARFVALAALALPFPSIASPALERSAEVAVVGQPGPQEVIAGLIGQVLGELDRNGGALRREPERLLPVVDRILLPHFDTDYTARLILGPHARAATPEQRERFAVAIYHAAVLTYSGELAELTADKLKILPSHEDTAATQATIRTQVMRAGGAPVEIDYRLHRTRQGWQTIDLIVEGISYVRNYRQDFDAEISQNGLDAVIARLERHDAGLASAAERSGTSANVR